MLLLSLGVSLAESLRASLVLALAVSLAESKMSLLEPRLSVSLMSSIRATANLSASWQSAKGLNWKTRRMRMPLQSPSGRRRILREIAPRMQRRLRGCPPPPMTASHPSGLMTHEPSLPPLNHFIYLIFQIFKGALILVSKAGFIKKKLVQLGCRGEEYLHQRQ